MTVHDVLEQIFGAEWHALSAYDRSAIIADAIDAAEHGCDAAEYKHRIGAAGDLQSYADALNASVKGAK
jgi:hypothetical protein